MNSTPPSTPSISAGYPGVQFTAQTLPLGSLRFSSTSSSISQALSQATASQNAAKTTKKTPAEKSTYSRVPSSASTTTAGKTQQTATKQIKQPLPTASGSVAKRKTPSSSSNTNSVHTQSSSRFFPQASSTPQSPSQDSSTPSSLKKQCGKPPQVDPFPRPPLTSAEKEALVQQGKQYYLSGHTVDFRTWMTKHENTLKDYIPFLELKTILYQQDPNKCAHIHHQILFLDPLNQSALSSIAYFAKESGRILSAENIIFRLFREWPFASNSLELYISLLIAKQDYEGAKAIAHFGKFTHREFPQTQTIFNLLLHEIDQKETENLINQAPLTTTSTASTASIFTNPEAGNFLPTSPSPFSSLYDQNQALGILYPSDDLLHPAPQHQLNPLNTETSLRSTQENPKEVVE